MLKRRAFCSARFHRLGTRHGLVVRRCLTSFRALGIQAVGEELSLDASKLDIEIRDE